MINLKQKIINDIKIAMQQGDTEKRDTLRMLVSAIKDEEIKNKKRENGLSSEEIIEVIARGIKQRRDSLNEYKKADRKDLAEKEEKEIDILRKYLPKQLSEEEVLKEVKKIIKEIGAVKKSDFGRVMGIAMRKLKGKTEGNIVKMAVEKELK